MITLTREEAQQVLGYLEEIHPGNMTPMAETNWNKAIEALRARLSAPEPEPVGWIYEDDEGRMMFSQMPQNPPLWEPVYRAKPREKNT
jgi:hypothetical protein